MTTSGVSFSRNYDFICTPPEKSSAYLSKNYPADISKMDNQLDRSDSSTNSSSKKRTLRAVQNAVDATLPVVEEIKEPVKKRTVSQTVRDEEVIKKRAVTLIFCIECKKNKITRIMTHPDKRSENPAESVKICITCYNRIMRHKQAEKMATEGKTCPDRECKTRKKYVTVWRIDPNDSNKKRDERRKICEACYDRILFAKKKAKRQECNPRCPKIQTTHLVLPINFTEEPELEESENDIIEQFFK